MAFDAFLKIDGVEGESTDDSHDKWIEVLSVSHALTQQSTGPSGGGAHSGGRVDHADITVVKSMDASSPQLCLACCNGKSHPTAVIEYCRAGEKKQRFYKLELTDVVITSISPFASGGGDFPQEEMTLTYGTIKWTYTKTDTRGKPGGDVVNGWDCKTNKKL